MEREHGRIVSVSTGTLGSTLVGDHAAGATSLLIFDAGDFDEDGGTLSINGATLAYASVDDDASTITLTDPLPAAASDGDKVQCWSVLYGTTVTEKNAMVQLDGDDDNPDPIEAWVPHFLADKISEGDRGGPGESVVLGYDEEDDEWQILDVRGLAGASGAGEKFEDHDTFTVAASGDQTIPLKHVPIDGSLDVKWHPDGLGGIGLTSAEWTLNGSTLTVPNSSGPFAAGDLIDPLYAYRDGPITPSADALSVPLGTDWKYATGLGGSTTYAQPTFDDSTWATGPSGFGLGPLHASEINTHLTTPMDVWTRLNVTSQGGDLVFTIDIDWQGALYVDGAQVWSTTDADLFTVTVPCTAGQHLIAAYAWDNTSTDSVLAVSIEEH